MKYEYLNNTDSNKLSINEVKKQKILQLSNREKLEYFDKIIIKYPLMNKILTKIEYCKSNSEFLREPECICVFGKPRSGKTTIMEQVMKKFPDVITETKIVKPILYCRVPCPAYTGHLISELIKATGDPFYTKQSSTNLKTDRLKLILKKCEVKLIILDEIQHLVDSNRQKVLLESSDWLKNLISDTRIPVLFGGLPNSERIFIENTQLGGRVLNRFHLEPFELNDNAFRIILKYFDNTLPLKINSGLASSDTWLRIYLATSGIMGYIKILLREALELALIYNLDLINIELLFEAYNNKLNHVLNINPFSQTFNVEKAIKNLHT